MKKSLFLLVALSVSGQAAKFPAEYVCDNGDRIHLTPQGTEQRLVYSSDKYGNRKGTLDVFKGEGEHKNESIGTIFSLDDYAGHPVAFTLQVKTVDSVVRNVTHNYQFSAEKVESGKCIPVKNGEMIEGDKNY